MNAPLRLFAKLSARSVARGGAACAAVGALLSGCANGPFSEAAVDPSSPVAEDVARIAREARDYPEFKDIPPVPTEQRKLAEWGKAADELEVVAARLDRETAANTWTLTGTERFAAQGRAMAGPDIDASASSTPATEAFAKELRERATPPPSPR